MNKRGENGASARPKKLRPEAFTNKAIILWEHLKDLEARRSIGLIEARRGRWLLFKIKRIFGENNCKLKLAPNKL